MNTCARRPDTSERIVDLRHARQAKIFALGHTIGSRMACCSEASSARLGCVGARGGSACGSGGGPAGQADQLTGTGAGCGMPTAQQGVPGSSAGSWQELCDSRDAPGIAWFSVPSGAEDARIGVGADTPNTLLMRFLQTLAPYQIKTLIQDMSMKACRLLHPQQVRNETRFRSGWMAMHTCCGTSVDGWQCSGG